MQYIATLLVGGGALLAAWCLAGAANQARGVATVLVATVHQQPLVAGGAKWLW